MGYTVRLFESLSNICWQFWRERYTLLATEFFLRTLFAPEGSLRTESVQSSPVTSRQVQSNQAISVIRFHTEYILISQWSFFLLARWMWKWLRLLYLGDCKGGGKKGERNCFGFILLTWREMHMVRSNTCFQIYFLISITWVLCVIYLTSTSHQNYQFLDIHIITMLQMKHNKARVNYVQDARRLTRNSTGWVLTSHDLTGCNTRLDVTRAVWKRLHFLVLLCKPVRWVNRSLTRLDVTWRDSLRRLRCEISRSATDKHSSR
jgi:hypothetical protein